MTNAYAILGFIRFVENYYIIVVTKRSVAGSIRDKVLYKVEDSKIISLDTHPKVIDRKEKKYRQIFNSFDLTRGFYFCYNYDLSHTF